MADEILAWIANSNPQILMTGIAALVLYVAAEGVRRALLRHITMLEARHKIRRAVSWTTIFLFLVITGLIWAPQIGNLGLLISILGAGLALSLQETLLCLAGWALIMLRKPLDIGDRVEIDGRKGDVIDIDVFQTTLLEVGNWVDGDQSTGRIWILPNSAAFRYSIYNYTKGFPFIWNEFSTIVTFESDWQAAKEIMLKQAQEEADKMEVEVRRQIQAMQKRYAIVQYDRLTPIVYTGIADNGVKLTLRHLTEVRQRRATMHRVSEAILEAFLAAPRIDFAYPTTRFFENPTEGKPGTGGPAPHAAPGDGTRM